MTGTDFLIIYTSFAMKRINLFQSRAYISSGNQVYFPIIMEEKTFILYEVDFHIIGNVLFCYEPVQFDIRRTWLDFNKASGGYSFFIDCSYPEAKLDGEMVFEDNICFQDRETEVKKEFSYFDYYGPGNLTARNNFISL